MTPPPPHPSLWPWRSLVWSGLVFFLLASAWLWGEVQPGTPAALPASLSATCANEPCGVLIQPRGGNRFRVVGDLAAGEVQMQVAFPNGSRDAVRYLILRSGSVVPGVRLQISGACAASPSTEQLLPQVELPTFLVRRNEISLPPCPSIPELRLTLRLDAASSTSPRKPVKLDLEEFFFADHLPGSRATPWAVLGVGGVLTTVLVGWGLRKLERRREILLLGCGFVFLFSLTVSLATLWETHDPEHWRDLRHQASMVAGEAYSSNMRLNLGMGSHLLQGEGPIYHPGKVAWMRMPGYAFVTALGGVLAGSATRLVDMAVQTVMLQTVLTALALSVLFASSLGVMTATPAFVTVVGIGLLPSQLYYPQIEAIMPALVLLLIAAGWRLVPHLDRGESLPLGKLFLFHGSCALWLLMRPDILPGWAALSLMLHWREPRRLWLPVVLFLVVGLPWALFKLPFTGEFNMTTVSFGASAMGGLWEVPHRFVWQARDVDYHRWLQDVGMESTTNAANRFATLEVMRFYLTYPGYVLSLFWSKLVHFVHREIWPGSGLPLWKELLTGTPVWAMFTVLFLSLGGGHRRWRTWMAAWPLFLNLPLFFLLYAGHGRFFNTAGVALLATTLPLLMDKAFVRGVWRKGSLPILGLGLALALGAQPLERWLLQNDALRYAAPFLDPRDSTLAVIRNEGEPFLTGSRVAKKPDPWMPPPYPYGAR